jgi:hypothetical protein
VLVWTVVSAVAFAGGGDSAGLVCLIEGRVGVVVPDRRGPEPATVLDQLPVGAEIRVDRYSRAIIVLFDGRRYELTSGTVAVVAADGPSVVRGEARLLGTLPVIAGMVSIDPTANFGIDTAAGRVRSGEEELADIMDLDPPTGGVVEADSTQLRFNPIDGDSRHRIVIDGPDGRACFVRSADTAEVLVPPGTLTSGTEYHWSVFAVHGEQVRHRVGAVFRTLDLESAQRRNRVADEVATVNTADSFLLLAAVDMSLGLRRESCDDLRRALDLGAAADAIRHFVSAIGCPEARAPSAQEQRPTAEAAGRPDT